MCCCVTEAGIVITKKRLAAILQLFCGVCFFLVLPVYCYQPISFYPLIRMLSHVCWIIQKAREFQKNIFFCFIDYAKAFDCVDHNKLWKILKDLEYQTT